MSMTWEKDCCNETDDIEITYKQLSEDEYSKKFIAFYICSDCKMPLLDEEGYLDVVSNQPHLVDDIIGFYMNRANEPEWKGNLDESIWRIKNA
tara:strand:+ start:15260 stop:15538 length:279 start_codon:yes stop_codon:yes gene_type:complete